MRFHLPSNDCPSRLPNGKPTELFILLHGYGADGFDLINLADRFKPLLPNAAFISPNAPTATPFGGYQWFPLNRLTETEIGEGAQQVAGALDGFIDAALAHFNLPGSRLILSGFSQGAMMSLHVGLRRKVAPMAIIGYSGALPLPERLPNEISVKPPVLLCHGGDDDVVPAAETLKATKTLTDCGVPVQSLIVPGYPHSVPPEALEKSARFIEDLTLLERKQA